MALTRRCLILFAVADVSGETVHDELETNEIHTKHKNRIHWVSMCRSTGMRLVSDEEDQDHTSSPKKKRGRNSANHWSDLTEDEQEALESECQFNTTLHTAY